MYPPSNFNIAMENGQFIDDLPIQKDDFSIINDVYPWQSHIDPVNRGWRSSFCCKPAIFMVYDNWITIR